MNRRRFLGTLAAAAVAPAIPKAPSALAFHKDAFRQAVEGISIRHIRQYDAASDLMNPDVSLQSARVTS